MGPSRFGVAGLSLAGRFQAAAFTGSHWPSVVRGHGVSFTRRMISTSGTAARLTHIIA